MVGSLGQTLSYRGQSKLTLEQQILRTPLEITIRPRTQDEDLHTQLQSRH